MDDAEYSEIKIKNEEEVDADVEKHRGTASETYTFRMMEFVTKKNLNGMKLLFLDVDPKTVARKVNLLKGLNVLRSDLSGCHYTAKGVKFVRRWLGMGAVSIASHVFPSKGKQGIVKYLEQKVALSKILRA